MVIPVPPKDSFDVEPGRYAAKCIDVRERSQLERKASNKRLRIVWEVKVPGGAESVRYLVAKNYEPTLTRHSELRDDLISWLGHDIQARTFDTATLKGREATITVTNIENDGWEKPYCYPALIEPPEVEPDSKDCRIVSPRVVCG